MMELLSQREHDRAVVIGDQMVVERVDQGLSLEHYLYGSSVRMDDQQPALHERGGLQRLLVQYPERSVRVGVGGREHGAEGLSQGEPQPLAARVQRAYPHVALVCAGRVAAAQSVDCLAAAAVDEQEVMARLGVHCTLERQHVDGTTATQVTQAQHARACRKHLLHQRAAVRAHTDRKRPPRARAELR
ncbi:MAG: hypothetical protein KF718_32500 [Polyangiaceae bacterium]|nr:hypothetical protein [Polyangiaceae bacterium]